MSHSPASSSLTITCPAKVNLALSVGAPVPPKGYHPLASWMVAVNFGDVLTLKKLDPSHSSMYHISFADDAPVKQEVDWPLEKDLVVRAHRLLAEHRQRPMPTQVNLSKKIPAGAGLGGGSSDAAAMLVGMNGLYGLGLDDATLVALGGRLGSDVAFLVAAMRGAPSSVVTGFGEEIWPMPLIDNLDLVLIFPGLRCPTGPVYQAFDSLPDSKQAQPDLERVRKLKPWSSLPQDGPFNDLAEPAFIVAPKLREIRDDLQKKMKLPIHVTGSGSTLFVVAPNETAAQVLARNVTALSGLPALATRTLASRRD